AEIMLPVISAVAAAHAEGILHRDLKPENIFLARHASGREHPTLLDFGVSRAISTPQGPQAVQVRTLTRAGEAIGTPMYMSPEHLAGDRDLDARTDQYSIGVILYVCSTGVEPFKDGALASLSAAIARGAVTPPSHHNRSLLPGFDQLVLQAMSVA